MVVKRKPGRPRKVGRPKKKANRANKKGKGVADTIGNTVKKLQATKILSSVMKNAGYPRIADTFNRLGLGKKGRGQFQSLPYRQVLNQRILGGRFMSDALDSYGMPSSLRRSSLASLARM